MRNHIPGTHRDHYQRHREAIDWVLAQLAAGARPDTFAGYWGLVKPIAGLRRRESRALWNVLRGERVERAVEIGRNMGGSLMLIVCACPDLREIVSLDIAPIAQVDAGLQSWLDGLGIAWEFIASGSQLVTPPRDVRDFVFVDGSHIGKLVAKDIALWKDHTRLLGFHDYTLAGRRTRYPGVVTAIDNAREANDWQPVGTRGGTEIVFRTGVE